MENIIAMVGVFVMGGEISFIGIKFQTPGLSTKILEWHKYLKEKKPVPVEKLKSTIETLNTTQGDKSVQTETDKEQKGKEDA